ncbi:ATP-binding cassette domain-containing protein [Phytomonospora endophytica]|uniref:ABC-2 type transport system ATP-binding protein n=1 Tax=Phytomonospora endophytica TaxID=714109 RepID=A0A841FDJ1_9ACTN|nr:ATP-binding cassette domain-containing protein [Phytomonospora endophytica]MBB6033515.1 ABC-2 type transport system ATP-binding protein [Phytomonospora endophytica]GIG64968.1 daunorubicin resistance protein DrrA family ABC transporter ATP-binding protein [Phytomonospora endophytica]
MTSPTRAVHAEGLTKRYGGKTALDSFDLTVPAGTVHGLLGPNGAGKTTAVRILATLLRFDAGRAEIAGVDLRRDAPGVRRRIGLVGQFAAVDEILSARQNLFLFGRLYHLSRPAARNRAAELLERFALTEAADRPVGRFSGGMRRRLDMACSLILAPRVLFLDEPTTGLDPRGRGEVWDCVRDLVAGGTSVLLTTQYLDEADQLADRISVLDEGKVVAEGTPGELKAKLGGDRLDVTVHDAAALDRTAAIMARVTGGEPQRHDDGRTVSVPVIDRVSALTEVVRELDAEGVTVEDLALRRPTLDEVFLHLTR